MTPFLLKGAIKLPNESPPRKTQVYDDNLQLWIDTQAGAPVVSAIASMADSATHRDGCTGGASTGVTTHVPRMTASQFGETPITETIEGIDQPEMTTSWASPFGETQHTATAEGIDKPEIPVAHQEDVDATYSHF